MKAKRNNKGYTLVEMLITLAIFGIIMIGIAMMMRTTSISYLKGSREVAMQTEVQIVANQVEELLVDATTGFSGMLTDAAGRKYCWIQSGTTKHWLVFDSVEQELLYDSTADGSSYTDDSLSLMAEYVSDFNITGWEKLSATPSDNCDNKVTIELAMNNEGYEYEVSRDVFFRNALEDATVYEIEGAAGGAETPEDAYTAKVSLDRYAVLNLQKEYGIVSDIAVTSNFATYYEFVNVTFRTGNTEVAKAISSASPAEAGTATAYIRVNAATTSSTTTSVKDTQGVVVSGKDANGVEKKILLTTDAVEFTVNTTEATADGVVYLSNKTGDGQGGYTWLGVKGIDIASMINISGKSYQYAMVAYIDTNNDQQYALVDSNKPTVKTVSTVSHGYSDGVALNNSGVQRGLALKADPETNGFILVQDNNALIANDNAKNAMLAGNMRLSIMIHLPSDSATGTHTVVDLAISAPGYDMQYYKGANTYNATPANWGITFTP
ncbi:MAG: prepilin-type N-terminal cleavage/methylation domain-containing protein [Lachnospiraceae bacterium]|nr:prepilin-type N-terminal cleavage/methylation domain-containing protein [Lachnospiraceae bacterium]